MSSERSFETIEKQVTITQYKTEDGRIFGSVADATEHNVWLDRKDYLFEKFYEEMLELNKDEKLFPYISGSFKTIEDLKKFIWIRLSENGKSEMGYVEFKHGSVIEFDRDMPFNYELWDELKYIMLKKYGYTLSVPCYYWGK